MSKQIERWSLPRGVTISSEMDGEFVFYSDHVADRAADKVEIDRLRSENVMIQAWRSRCELAEARIAELEASQDEAVRRDALERGFELGWMKSADWAQRDDLYSDIGSPAYVEIRDAAIKSAEVEK